MAEREGFEPPIALRLCLISSQVHSTGLCHLSVGLLVASPGCAGARRPAVQHARSGDIMRTSSPGLLDSLKSAGSVQCAS